ncbi:hypothetical protein ABK040_000778 [Willaertia magna]
MQLFYTVHLPSSPSTLSSLTSSEITLESTATSISERNRRISELFSSSSTDSQLKINNEINNEIKIYNNYNGNILWNKQNIIFYNINNEIYLFDPNEPKKFEKFFHSNHTNDFTSFDYSSQENLFLTFDRFHSIFIFKTNEHCCNDLQLKKTFYNENIICAKWCLNERIFVNDSLQNLQNTQNNLQQNTQEENLTLDAKYKKKIIYCKNLANGMRSFLTIAKHGKVQFTYLDHSKLRWVSSSLHLNLTNLKFSDFIIFNEKILIVACQENSCNAHIYFCNILKNRNLDGKNPFDINVTNHFILNNDNLINEIYFLKFTNNLIYLLIKDNLNNISVWKEDFFKMEIPNFIVNYLDINNLNNSKGSKCWNKIENVFHDLNNNNFTNLENIKKIKWSIDGQFLIILKMNLEILIYRWNDNYFELYDSFNQWSTTNTTTFNTANNTTNNNTDEGLSASSSSSDNNNNSNKLSKTNDDDNGNNVNGVKKEDDNSYEPERKKVKRNFTNNDTLENTLNNNDEEEKENNSFDIIDISISPNNAFLSILGNDYKIYLLQIKKETIENIIKKIELSILNSNDKLDILLQTCSQLNEDELLQLSYELEKSRNSISRISYQYYTNQYDSIFVMIYSFISDLQKRALSLEIQSRTCIKWILDIMRHEKFTSILLNYGNVYKENNLDNLINKCDEFILKAGDKAENLLNFASISNWIVRYLLFLKKCMIDFVNESNHVINQNTTNQNNTSENVTTNQYSLSSLYAIQIIKNYSLVTLYRELIFYAYVILGILQNSYNIEKQLNFHIFSKRTIKHVFHFVWNFIKFSEQVETLRKRESATTTTSNTATTTVDGGSVVSGGSSVIASGTGMTTLQQQNSVLFKKEMIDILKKEVLLKNQMSNTLLSTTATGANTSTTTGTGTGGTTTPSSTNVANKINIGSNTIEGEMSSISTFGLDHIGDQYSTQQCLELLDLTPSFCGLFQSSNTFGLLSQKKRMDTITKLYPLTLINTINSSSSQQQAQQQQQGNQQGSNQQEKIKICKLCHRVTHFGTFHIIWGKKFETACNMCGSNWKLLK